MGFVEPVALDQVPETSFGWTKVAPPPGSCAPWTSRGAAWGGARHLRVVGAKQGRRAAPPRSGELAPLAPIVDEIEVRAPHVRPPCAPRARSLRNYLLRPRTAQTRCPRSSRRSRPREGERREGLGLGAATPRCLPQQRGVQGVEQLIRGRPTRDPPGGRATLVFNGASRVPRIAPIRSSSSAISFVRSASASSCAGRNSFSASPSRRAAIRVSSSYLASQRGAAIPSRALGAAGVEHGGLPAAGEMKTVEVRHVSGNRPGSTAWSQDEAGSLIRRRPA